jgi:hypothetical protein
MPARYDDLFETAALDVLDALIAATYTRSRGSLLADANLGLERLRFFMRLSREPRLIDTRRYEHAVRCIASSPPYLLGGSKGGFAPLGSPRHKMRAPTRRGVR